MIASAIWHRRASSTELDRHVDDALQDEGFAHLAAVAPKHEPDGDGALGEVVELSARRRRARAAAGA